MNAQTNKTPNQIDGDGKMVIYSKQLKRDSGTLDVRGRPAASTEDLARLEWWSKARFGMFIHWGLYAVPGGWWKGNQVKGIAEWIMHEARVPVAEYQKLTSRFNPIKYNAEEWVKLAKIAGAKYIVITSKHHDGFAMFNSSSNDYNIAKATPFGRDPIKELANACQKSGIKLGFYHSQDQDWHHPGGSGNDWDYPNRTPEEFANYLEVKVKPQLRELLTQYGPVALIWFDTPYSINRNQSLELQQLVHELQPDCLVSGRIGNGVGDYGSLGDNQIPIGRVKGFWETPATMNDTWGFKHGDENWKSAETLISLLVDLASKGVNYLLNVGPTDEGIIPQPSVDRMAEIGKWLDTNGEAIYGTTASPFPISYDWGGVTEKANKLYLLIREWPKTPFILHGLRNKVTNAYLLADAKTTLSINQHRNKDLDHDILELTLPTKRPDQPVSVVVLELNGKPIVDPIPLQQPNGSVTLPSSAANLHNKSGTRPIEISRSGTTENWTNKSNWISWKFKIVKAGNFAVVLVTGQTRKSQSLAEAYSVNISIADKSLQGTVQKHSSVNNPRAQYFPEIETRMGNITIDRTGVFELKLRADHIQKNSYKGLSVVSIELKPTTI